MPDEVQANFRSFEQRWTADLATALQALSADASFERAYRTLVSMQAWRSELLEDEISPGALQFVLEGQNDLLVSYILARGGQWRSALQSLRAALENYLSALYFKDHPVELELWHLGKFRPTYSESLAYLKGLPQNIGKDSRTYGYDILKSEYATLSKAVHGSAVAFRMANEQGPSFFVVDQVKLRQWLDRLRQVVRGLNLMLLASFADHLIGARKRGLRVAMTGALRRADKPWVKAQYGVTLPF